MVILSDGYSEYLTRAQSAPGKLIFTRHLFTLTVTLHEVKKVYLQYGLYLRKLSVFTI